MCSFVPCLIGREVDGNDWDVGVLGYSSIGEDDVAVRGATGSDMGERRGEDMGIAGEKSTDPPPP